MVKCKEIKTSREATQILNDFGHRGYRTWEDLDAWVVATVPNSTSNTVEKVSLQTWEAIVVANELNGYYDALKAALPAEPAKPTYTRGPWNAQGVHVSAPDGSDICHTGGTRFNKQGTPQPEESVCNARLIAAAPDLLEAAIAMLESIGRSPVEVNRVKANIKAAIDKAVEDHDE
jgi:hypothetical protein